MFCFSALFPLCFKGALISPPTRLFSVFFFFYFFSFYRCPFSFHPFFPLESIPLAASYLPCMNVDVQSLRCFMQVEQQIKYSATSLKRLAWRNQGPFLVCISFLSFSRYSEMFRFLGTRQRQFFIRYRWVVVVLLGLLLSCHCTLRI